MARQLNQTKNLRNPKSLLPKEAKVLWDKYIKDKNNLSARNALICYYIHLVQYVARKLHSSQQYPACVTLADMVSSGNYGLLQAVKRFDPTYGCSFATYAIHRIHGAILDDLRRSDRAPRESRKQEAQSQAAIEQLQHLLGKNPTDDEVTEHCGKTITDHRHPIQSPKSLSTLSYEYQNSGKKISLSDILFSNAKRPRNSSRLFEQLTRGIEFQSRLYLWLYFIPQWTMKEVGQITGVTESRVSQCIAEALRKIRQNCSRHEAFSLHQDTCGRHATIPGDLVADD